MTVKCLQLHYQKHDITGICCAFKRKTCLILRQEPRHWLCDYTGMVALCGIIKTTAMLWVGKTHIKQGKYFQLNLVKVGERRLITLSPTLHIIHTMRSTYKACLLYSYMLFPLQSFYKKLLKKKIQCINAFFTGDSQYKKNLTLKGTWLSFYLNGQWLFISFHIQKQHEDIQA